MAIDGDTIAIGAYEDDSDRGAVYVFRTSDGGVTYGQVAKLTAADAASDDNLGYSMAIDGNTIVVGSRYDDDGGSNSGSVYVFRTTDGGATYGQVAKLTASGAYSTTSATPWRSMATPSWPEPTATTTAAPNRALPTSSALN